MRRFSASWLGAELALGESGDHTRRRASAALAWASMAYHLFVLVGALRGQREGVIMSLVGLGASAMMVRASRDPHGLPVVQRWALALGGSWLLTDLVHGARRGDGVGASMLIDLFALTLLLFTLLPAQRATAWSLLAYGAFVASALLAGERDLSPILAMGLVVWLTSFTTSYGRAVAQEQARILLLEQQLREDGLTGVLNRRAAEESLAALSAGERGVVLLADVDHFKVINDRFGHLAGDEALRQVAHTLKRSVGSAGEVGRWGGEEFVVLLPGAGPEQGRESAERLLRDVRALRDAEPLLTLSIGGVNLTEASTVSGLIAQADRRLYAAKALGRDRAVFADAAPPPQPEEGGAFPVP